jgi:geranylgeranyl diphosphate synthase type II
MNFDIKAYLQEKQELVNEHLDKCLPIEGDYPKEVAEAMRYSLLAGGKRLRPILTIAACEAIGGKAQDAMKVACAIECIQTYSLIHDDLPAMDDDDYRRGKPTCHKVYGEAMAILAGDGLLTYAFELLANTSENNGLDNNKNLIRIIREVAMSVGIKGMIAGQVVDMLSEKGQREKSIELLEYIHKNKTSALFKASIKSGALVAGANDAELAALDAYAHHFGLAFQITDDILDIESTSSELGKPVGSDEKNQKLTYPLLYGLEKSKEMAVDNVDAAVNSLSIFGDKAIPLVSLVKYVLTRSN